MNRFLLLLAQKTVVYTRKLHKKGNRVLCSSSVLLIVWSHIIKMNFVFSLRGACVMCNFSFRNSAFWHVEAVSTVQLTLTHPEDGIQDEGGKLRHLQYKTPRVPDG
jgi:hypothetical protein